MEWIGLEYYCTLCCALRRDGVGIGAISYVLYGRNDGFQDPNSVSTF